MKSKSALGMTLIEVLAATAISGLVALAAMTSARIALRAWEKQQQAVLELRRATGVEDILHIQLSNHLVRQAIVVTADRRQPIGFFFGEPQRLVFLTSYSARERGRGGIVVADYFAEPRPGGGWDLWLDEYPALDEERLGEVVEDIVSASEGLQPVLRPFRKEQALLMWKDLRECGFHYRRELPAPAGWVTSWSLLSSQQLPPAVSVQLRGDQERSRGLAPVPLFVRLRIGGVR